MKNTNTKTAVAVKRPVGRPARSIKLPIGKTFTVKQVAVRLSNLKRPVTTVTIHNHIKALGDKVKIVDKKITGAGRPEQVFFIEA